MTIARHLIETDEGLDAARSLAIDALRLGRLLREPARWPARWAEPSFGKEVERIRRRIARYRSQETLARAYGRDVARLSSRRADHAEGSPIRVAYALRFLELQDGVIGPSWPAMVG